VKVDFTRFSTILFALVVNHFLINRFRTACVSMVINNSNKRESSSDITLLFELEKLRDDCLIMDLGDNAVVVKPSFGKCDCINYVSFSCVIYLLGDCEPTRDYRRVEKKKMGGRRRRDQRLQ
jgi:hypothetical protein